MVGTQTSRQARFVYVRPECIRQAIQYLSDPRFTNRILSGGTDLMVALRDGPPGFDRVVDISHIPALKVIQKQDQQITLGAGVTFSEIIESDLLNQEAPFLVEAARLVGSPQIRNQGTIGGNIANAAACADTLPVLICLNADAHLSGYESVRQMPVSQLITRPNRTLIEPGELLTHFSFTSPPFGARTVFLKISRRNTLAISRLTIAIVGGVDSRGCINLARITPGAAVPVSQRIQKAEQALIGELPTPELMAKVARQISNVIFTIAGRRWSTEYKEKALTVLAERALKDVFLG